MKKILIFVLLFIFLAFFVIFVLVQTSIGKDKIRGMIQKKTEGKVSVGKIEGLIPFWVRLHDVQYQSGSTHVSADEMHLVFSPTSFFFGKLSLFKLHINQTTIQTGEETPSELSLNWPSIFELEINSLTFNNLKDISLSGKGGDYAYQFKAIYDQYTVHLGLEADAPTQTIAIRSHVEQDHAVNLWVSGIYDVKTETFNGSIHGKAYTWTLNSPLSFSDSILTFSEAKLTKEGISAEGRFVFNLDTHVFQANGLFLEHPFSTDGELTWTEGNVDLSHFTLHYTHNMFCGHLTYHTKTETFTGELDFQLHDFSPLPTEFPVEGTGLGHLTMQPNQTCFTLSGDHVRWKDLSFSEMTLEGTFKDHQLSFALFLKDFIVLDPAYEVFPNAHLELSGTGTKDSLSIQGKVLGLGTTPFTLSAQIPLNFSTNPFDISIDRASPFSLNLKGNGSIDPILAFLENASLIARGDLDVDLTLSGTWDNPTLTGSMIYENGWVESLATGALYRGIHMELEGEGRALKIRSMIAHDLKRGDLSGTGQIEWNPQKGFPFELMIHTKQFTLLAIDPLTTTVDAQITLSGTLHEMSIKGTATIVEGHLSIPNKMPTQVPTLAVTYINPLPTPKPEVEEEKKPLPINWDVEIDIPNHLTIDGRGLVSEWRGHLHMFGLQNALQYTGKLKLIQGRFTVVGRTFDLVVGKIQIEGLEPKDIVVELKGDLELATLTASLNVTGSLDAAHIAFTSNPPMSTNQILSWILFNQDVNELTPFQACRLANVLVQLSGKYAGPSVFNHIKEGLGIDVFDITNCDMDSSDFTFQVGKYISQGTFVGVSKSISGDFDSVLIQTRLYRDFFLEADYGGSLNGITPNSGKMIFKWYRTY